MYLLLTIPFICFFMSFLNFFAPKILAVLLPKSQTEKQLLAEIMEIKMKLEKLSMRDNYVNYIQLERQMNSKQANLDRVKSENQSKRLILNYGVTYGSKVLLTLTLIIISITYRGTPVIIFDNRFDFTPFNSLIRFPTGVNGAISVPFWIFVNSFVSKNFASYIH